MLNRPSHTPMLPRLPLLLLLLLLLCLARASSADVSGVLTMGKKISIGSKNTLTKLTIKTSSTITTPTLTATLKNYNTPPSVVFEDTYTKSQDGSIVFKQVADIKHEVTPFTASKPEFLKSNHASSTKGGLSITLLCALSLVFNINNKKSLFFLLASFYIFSLLPSASAGSLVYDDALASGWQDISSSGAVNYASTSPVRSGAKSLAVTSTASWIVGKILCISGDCVAASQYAGIGFYVNGGTNSGQNLMFEFVGVGPNNNIYYAQTTSLSTYIAANTWTYVYISIPAGGAYRGFQWRALDYQGTPTVWIDDVNMIAVGASSTTATPGTTKAPTTTAPPTTTTTSTSSTTTTTTKAPTTTTTAPTTTTTTKAPTTTTAAPTTTTTKAPTTTTTTTTTSAPTTTTNKPTTTTTTTPTTTTTTTTTTISPTSTTSKPITTTTAPTTTTSTTTKSPGTSSPASGLFTMGYYPAYAKWGTPPSSIDYSKLTHIAVGAVNVKSTGEIVQASYAGSMDDWKTFAGDVVTRAHAAGTKAVLMLGGEGGNSNDCQGPFNSATSTSLVGTFASNLVSHAQSLNFDGIDLDWEECVDYAGLERLAVAVRQQWNNVFLTFPVGAMSIDTDNNPSKYLSVSKYLDSINLMSYIPPDNYGGWDGPWHVSPLKGYTPYNPAGFHPYSIKYAVDAFVAAGIPRSKIGMGMGFFGSCWGSPITQPVQTLGGNHLKAGDNTMSHKSISTSYISSMTYNYDTTAEVPYLSSSTEVGPAGCTYISYDNDRSIKAKADYAKAESLGGLIIWTVNQGILNDGTNPSLTSVNTYFGRSYTAAVWGNSVSTAAPSTTTTTTAAASSSAGSSSTTSAPAATSSSSTPASVTTSNPSLAPDSSFVIYSEQVNTPWRQESWFPPHYNFASTVFAHSGSKSASFTPSSYEALAFKCDGCLNTGWWSGVEFWVNGGSGVGKQNIFFTMMSGNNIAGQIHIACGIPVGYVPPNTWTKVFIPFSAISGVVDNTVYTGFLLRSTENNPEDIYFDDIKIVKKGDTSDAPAINCNNVVTYTPPTSAPTTTTSVAPSTAAPTTTTTTTPLILEPYYELVLEIPEGYSLDDLSVLLQNGDLTSTGDLNVYDALNAYVNGTVDIAQLSVAGSATIESVRSSSVRRVKQLDSTTDMKITSTTGSADIAFAKSYAGTYSVQAAKATISDSAAACTPSSSSSGVCSNTQTSTLTVNAPSANVQLSYSCPTEPILTQEFISVSPPSQQFLTMTSAYVTIPTMSQLPFDPSNANDCPHKQAGLKRWEDASTWPTGIVPSPSQSINIPENTKVLVSSCTFNPADVYTRVYVPKTSELIWDDAPIEWHVHNIQVDGAFRIGSPTCRVQSHMKLIFHGAKTTQEDLCQYCGSKGLASTGVVEVHGKQYHPTWTRASATIWPGNNTIFLQEKTNWVVGQTIAVTTTIREDYYEDQNEVRVITGVTADGKAIRVDRPFTYIHYAGEEYQAEVVLISRNILFQGADDSVAEQFGGHVIVRGGEGRFSGLQLTRMGQTNMLARYPLHFHMLKDKCNNCYVRDCSMYQTYFRCVAIHATHNVTVTRNTAFNVTGNCYYLEEGVEENNTFTYNFAGKVNYVNDQSIIKGDSQGTNTFYSSPTLIQPADAAASGFYITNMYNTFIGNAASGGWAGFSFPNLKQPIETNRNTPFVPDRRKTLKFDGNTAHSSGNRFTNGGGCFYVGGTLSYVSSSSDQYMYTGSRNSRETSNLPYGTVQEENWEWSTFTNTKAYLCELGFSHWGLRTEVRRFEAHDVKRSVQIFGMSWLDSALVNMRSANPVKFSTKLQDTDTETNQQGFQFYDTWVQTILSNVTFSNIEKIAPITYAAPWGWYNWKYDNRAIITMSHAESEKPQGIAAMSNIKFINVSREIRIGHKFLNTSSSRYYNIFDWDGSVAGTGVPTILGSSQSQWYRYDPSCVLENDWNMWSCPAGNRKVAYLSLLIPGLIEDSCNNDLVKTIPPVGSVSLFGPNIPAGRSVEVTKCEGIAGVTGIGWYFNIEQGSPTTMKIKPYLLPQNSYIIFAMSYPAGTTFSVQTYGASRDMYLLNPKQAGTFAEVLASDGDKWYFDGTNFYLKVINVNARVASAQDHYTFTRAGVNVYIQDVQFYYTVTANCPGVTAGSGVNCQASRVYPTAWN